MIEPILPGLLLTAAVLLVFAIRSLVALSEARALGYISSNPERIV